MNGRKGMKRNEQKKKNRTTRRMGSNQLEMFEWNRLHTCVCVHWNILKNGNTFGFETNLNKCSDTMDEECARLPTVSACVPFYGMDSIMTFYVFIGLEVKVGSFICPCVRSFV